MSVSESTLKFGFFDTADEAYSISRLGVTKVTEQTL